MLFNIGSGFRLQFDSKDWVLRVFTNVNIFFADGSPIWSEKDSFATSADWEASPYATLVSGVLEEQIMWFWIDKEDVGKPQLSA